MMRMPSLLFFDGLWGDGRVSQYSSYNIFDYKGWLVISIDL